MNELEINLDELAWFNISPEVGDPDCICSYCGFVIPEDDVPIRLYRKNNTEARLHIKCFELLRK